MRYLEKYTGDKTYMFPNGKLATKEKVLAEFESILTFPHIIETDANSEVMFAVYNLSAMRTQYNIDSSLTEEEAIQAIQDIMNEPAPVQEPQTNAQTEALENIAAQLEYQNMMTLDDVDTSETV